VTFVIGSDAFHVRQKIRFVSARGEAGACNMADAYARVTGTLGVCVTSTGTGCGNAAGAMVEALTAGTPLLHLTGQIESDYLDRDLGYIHEHPAQLAMLQSVGKAAFRIRNPETALATLREAVSINAGRAVLEVSGGVNMDTVQAIAATGVDRISIGALTKDIRAVDFSMRMEDV
jgi:acetolactate synthase-1/2/3 large subunit